MNILVSILFDKKLVLFYRILILSILSSSCIQENEPSCTDLKSIYIEKNIDIGESFEDWFIYVFEENPNLLYDDVETFHQKTKISLFPLIKSKVIECIISVEKDGINKTFSINSKPKDINIISETKVHLGAGTTNMKKRKYPYSSLNVDKLINCKIDGIIHNCILLQRSEILYDNGISITVECYIN